MRYVNKIFDIYRILFARPSFVKFNKFLFRITLKGLGVTNNGGYNITGEKFFIEKILKKISNQSPVFFDVGANVGSYTEFLLRYFHDAVVYAFEPHPFSCSQLKSKDFDGDVRVFNIGFSNVPGKAVLYDRKDCGGGSSHASLYSEVIEDIHKQEMVECLVDLDVMDDFVLREGIDFVDFLKIDTEGNELLVLSGAKKLLSQKRIKCIQFEFNEMNVVSRVFFRDFRNILSGYKLYRILPHGLMRLDESPLYTEIFAYQNIVAITAETANDLGV